jgi:hypothetical protein
MGIVPLQLKVAVFLPNQIRYRAYYREDNNDEYPKYFKAPVCIRVSRNINDGIQAEQYPGC